MVSQVPATTIQAGGVSWPGSVTIVFSVLTVEAASVTLTQTVVAIQDSAQSCCRHLTKLTALISMTGDGLPIAYTQEELYDTVVSLRSRIKKDKELLAELDLLFSFVSKLLDSVAETSFLGITSSRVT